MVLQTIHNVRSLGLIVQAFFSLWENPEESLILAATVLCEAGEGVEVPEEETFYTQKKKRRVPKYFPKNLM